LITEQRGETAQGRLEAGAEDSVDEEVCIVEGGEDWGGGEGGFIGDEEETLEFCVGTELGVEDFFEFAEDGGGIAVECVEVAEEEDTDIATCGDELMRGDETIPAIVAFATEDEGALGGGTVMEDESGDSSPGVVHEGEQRDVEFGGSALVG